MYGFTFDGKHNSQITGLDVVMEYNVAMLPEFDNTLISLPKRDGVLDFGRTLKERVIPVRFQLRGDNVQDYFTKAFAVADWLNVDTAKELRLDAIPNKRIFARLKNGIDPERFARVGKIEVEFLCPDPAFESTTERNFVAAQNTNYTNGGTRPIKPYFSIKFTAAQANPFRLNLNGTNKFILINSTFALNDILVVDIRTRKFTKNGADIRQLVDVTSAVTSFQIPKGVFQLSANTANVQITTIFREKWV